MASTYKTPGVYVEEIPLFPPSVAQVETAVPAFIGYTQIASKNGESLLNKPTKIFSLSEFESYFGKGPDVSYSVYLDTSDSVTQVTASQTYYLYESMRLFYENGGGKCYIISIGPYNGTVDISKINAALTPLEKEDEPTLIISPDAVLANASAVDLYTFQQKALLQCAKLGDRFLICDLLKSNEAVANETLQDRVDDFRNNIGINNLKYGAAYTPYIYSSLPKTIRFRNVNLFRGDPSSNTPLTLEALTAENNIIQLIFDLGNAKKASDDLKAIVAPAPAPGILSAGNKTLEEEYKKLFDDYAAAATEPDRLNAARAIYTFTLAILAAVNDFQATLPAKVAATPVPASKASSKSFVLKDDVTGIVNSTGTAATFEKLIQHSNAAFADDNAGELMTEDPTNAAALLNKALVLLGIDPTTYDTITDPAIDALYGGASAAVKNAEARKAIAAAYPAIIAFFYEVQNAAAGYETTLDNSLAASFGMYKNILSKISISTSALPPSGAVAGIYALVDSQRGVWKAPANVSLSGVIGPVVPIANAVQDDLNVDTNAGKSINVVRAFTGKGTLIWGARTLAGNDNEWRYISVRRFFNMAEESIKKATGQFVFEPNDANTWVKVKGMIENFLTIQWRQGALAGAKPEHAFFVKVGLGQTMTAVDVLEGRMNVEIGMAVVRPAEFIILKFSHKMQES